MNNLDKKIQKIEIDLTLENLILTKKRNQKKMKKKMKFQS